MLPNTLVYAHSGPKYTQRPITMHLSKLPRMLALRHLREIRARNSVASELGKDVEKDTRVRSLVEASSRDAAAQLGRSTTAHDNVDALRVRLCAVGGARGVQRDDLVAQDVVARREVGNGQVPGEIVLDEIVGCPCAGVAAGFPGLGLDLGPGQGEGRDAAEVARDGSYVFLYGSDVGAGPCVPVRIISTCWM